MAKGQVDQESVWNADEAVQGTLFSEKDQQGREMDFGGP